MGALFTLLFSLNVLADQPRCWITDDPKMEPMAKYSTVSKYFCERIDMHLRYWLGRPARPSKFLYMGFIRPPKKSGEGLYLVGRANIIPSQELIGVPLKDRSDKQLRLAIDELAQKIVEDFKQRAEKL